MRASYKVTDRLTLDEDVPNRAVACVVLGMVAALFVGVAMLVGSVWSVVSAPSSTIPTTETVDQRTTPTLGPYLSTTTVPRTLPPAVRQ